MRYVLMCLFCLYCVYVAGTEAYHRIQYEQAYEASRAELEAFMRTKGRHINSSYICRSKK